MVSLVTGVVGVGVVRECVMGVGVLPSVVNDEAPGVGVVLHRSLRLGACRINAITNVMLMRSVNVIR